MTKKAKSALVLLRQALELIDNQDDPWVAGPHVSMAIDRIEGFTGALARNDNFEGGECSRRS